MCLLSVSSFLGVIFTLAKFVDLHDMASQKNIKLKLKIVLKSSTSHFKAVLQLAPDSMLKVSLSY